MQRPADDSSGLSAVYFLRLKLYDDKGVLLSTNTYLLGKEYLNYMALNTLPRATVAVSQPALSGNHLTFTVTNRSRQSAAVGVRVQLLDNNNKQILPALISDSYFNLMQEEQKQVQIAVDKALLKNGYRLEAKAYND